MKISACCFLLLLPNLVFGATLDTTDTADTIGPFGSTERDWTPELQGSESPRLAPAGWMEEARLSANDGHESIDPRFVSDSSGTIHMVWKDNWHAHNEILYRSGSGSAWGDIYTISHPDTNHNSADIAIDQDQNLHVTYLRWCGIPWGGLDLGYRKFNSSLGVWEPEERLTVEEGLDTVARPQILCTTDGCTFIIWYSEIEPHSLWYIIHDGSDWGEKQIFTDLNDSPLGFFGVTIAPDNTIHCIWQDDRSGVTELYHRIYRDDAWTASMPVTSGGFACVHPRMSPDAAGNIHLVYGGGPSLYEKIHVLSWDASIETWGPETIFPSQMAYPHIDIAVDPANDDIHLTYYDYISGNYEIVYKYYDAGTGTWDPSLQLTSGHPDLRVESQIALDPSGAVHIAWYDYRDLIDHQEEIYYTTNRDLSGVDDPVMMISSRIIAAPNPFNGTTQIRLTGGSGTEVAALEIFDIQGRLIDLINPISAGSDYEMSYRWSGYDSRGVECPPGVYFLRTLQSGGSQGMRIIKIK